MDAAQRISYPHYYEGRSFVLPESEYDPTAIGQSYVRLDVAGAVGRELR